MLFKTSILILLSCHFVILTMAGVSSSSVPPPPEATWRHMRNFIEKKGEFAEDDEKEEPMETSPGEQYTIISGGAEGADAYAERLGLAYECRLDIKLGPRHPRAKCISPIKPNEADLYHAQQVIKKANTTLKRKDPSGNGTYFEELLLRNYFIARECYALYAFGYLQADSKTVQGGTGWTVQMAVDMGKTVFLYDLTTQTWYEFIYYQNQTKLFQFRRLRATCLSLYHKAAIVGSRQFTEQGKKAMRRLFQTTFLR